MAKDQKRTMKFSGLLLRLRKGGKQILLTFDLVPFLFELVGAKWSVLIVFSVMFVWFLMQKIKRGGGGSSGFFCKIL